MCTWNTQCDMIGCFSPDSHMFLCGFCSVPISQVCCSGLLHTKKPHYHCCEESYRSFSNSSDPICCNGKLLPALLDHQCCGGYYVQVKTCEFQITFLLDWRLSFSMFLKSVLVFVDEYCCPDPSQGRVSVGLGDSCCGAFPYSRKFGQLCCSGSLHDGYGVQCCGGRIVHDTLVCCGDAVKGEVHVYNAGEWRSRCC